MHEPELYLLFIRPLNKIKIDYMVTGATAAIIYGTPRFTNDLDLVIDLSTSDVTKFMNSFSEKTFYVPPEEVIKVEVSRDLYGHINLLHADTGYKADCYFIGKDPLHLWAMKNRLIIEVGNEKIWIAPPEYVIIRKLQYYREGGAQKHINDIRNMLAVSGDTINYNQLEDKIRELSLNKEWRLFEKK